MLEEVLIFNRKKSIHQDLWDVTKLRQSPLAAIAAVHRGDRLGLQSVRTNLPVVLKRQDRGDAAIVEQNFRGIGAEVGARPRIDFHSIGTLGIGAHQIALFRSVTTLAKLQRYGFPRRHVSRFQNGWFRIECDGTGVRPLFQLAVNQPRKRDVDRSIRDNDQNHQYA